MKEFSLLLLAGALLAAEKRDDKSALDKYIHEATSRWESPAAASPGSLWTASSPLSDLARDVRAAHVDDLVTILVVERADAVSSGDTKTSRQSSVKSSLPSVFGPAAAAHPAANLANLSGSSGVQGQGATTRQTALTTTLSARVAHVLPNGYLVVEGHKDTVINSERQTVVVRGVVRPVDLGPDNTVTSDRLAQLELRINGKGVVGDAIRRPNFLYRILMGVLAF